MLDVPFIGLSPWLKSLKDSGLLGCDAVFLVSGAHCCGGTRCILLTLKWMWHGIIFQNTRVLSCTAVNTQHSKCASCWVANGHLAGYMLCLLWVWTIGYQIHQGLPSW